MSKFRFDHVRMAFPSIFKTREGGLFNEAPHYEATFIVDPDNAKLQPFAVQCIEILAAKLGDPEAAKRALKAKPFIKRGDDRAKVPEGFEGKYCFVAKSETQPLFYSADKQLLTPEDARPIFYSGCYVNVLLDVWPYNVKGNRGVSCTLRALQFCGHGDAFTGRTAVSEDDFDDCSAAASATSSAAADGIW